MTHDGLTSHRRKQRHRARQMAVQAFYQLQFNDASCDQVMGDIRSARAEVSVDELYYQRLVRGMFAKQSEFAQAVVTYLDRPLSDLGQVELAILQLAYYELLECLDVPMKVIINESVELAKIYGAQDSHKYINAIADRLGQQFRPDGV